LVEPLGALPKRALILFPFTSKDTNNIFLSIN
jgi:hypothetical protein